MKIVENILIGDHSREKWILGISLKPSLIENLPNKYNDQEFYDKLFDFHLKPDIYDDEYTIVEKINIPVEFLSKNIISKMINFNEYRLLDDYLTKQMLLDGIELHSGNINYIDTKFYQNLENKIDIISHHIRVAENDWLNGKKNTYKIFSMLSDQLFENYHGLDYDEFKMLFHLLMTKGIFLHCKKPIEPLLHEYIIKTIKDQKYPLYNFSGVLDINDLLSLMVKDNNYLSELYFRDSKFTVNTESVKLIKILLDKIPSYIFNFKGYEYLNKFQELGIMRYFVDNCLDKLIDKLINEDKFGEISYLVKFLLKFDEYKNKVNSIFNKIKDILPIENYSHYYEELFKMLDKNEIKQKVMSCRDFICDFEILLKDFPDLFSDDDLALLCVDGVISLESLC